MSDRIHSYELIHYGVKEMKWGVRRTPEQLGYKKPLGNSIKSDTISTETKNNKAMIVYSRTGAHIYPRKEKKDES